MGFASGGAAGSGFRRDYQQSPWEKSKAITVGDLQAFEYKRHVTNPPPGRTRTQYQLVVDSAHLLPPKLLSVYNRLLDSQPAVANGIVLADRVVITNPPQGWKDLETTYAKKTMLTKDEMSFPSGFQKVDSVSELFLSDSSNSSTMEGSKKFLQKMRGEHNFTKEQGGTLPAQ